MLSELLQPEQRLIWKVGMAIPVLSFENRSQKLIKY